MATGIAALVLGLEACGQPTGLVSPSPVPPVVVPTSERADRRKARVAALYPLRLAPSGATSGYAGQQFGDEVYVELQIDRGRGKVKLQINV